MKLLGTMIASGLALVLQGGFAAVHADTSTSGHCTAMTVTDYISSASTSTTNSTAWQNVIDAHLNFTTSGVGCVIITFSGPANVAPSVANDYAVLHVRTLLDGNNLCVPALFDDRFSEAQVPVPVTANSITRICKNVAARPHAIQVQFHSDNSNYFVYIHSSLLTVTHN
jgi:hypothetical protein